MLTQTTHTDVMSQAISTDVLQLQGMISHIPGTEGMSQGTGETTTETAGMTPTTGTEMRAAMRTSRDGYIHQSVLSRQTAMGAGMPALTGISKASIMMAMQIEETPTGTVQKLLVMGLGDLMVQGLTAEPANMACLGGRLLLKSCKLGTGAKGLPVHAVKAALRLFILCPLWRAWCTTIMRVSCSSQHAWLSAHLYSTCS